MASKPPQARKKVSVFGLKGLRLGREQLVFFKILDNPENELKCFFSRLLGVGDGQIEIQRIIVATLFRFLRKQAN